MSANGSHPFTPSANPRQKDCVRCGLPEAAHSGSNGHVVAEMPPLLAAALEAERDAAKIETTDPVPPRVGEPMAVRRMREAQALAVRLEREAATEKAGGPERSRW